MTDCRGLKIFSGNSNPDLSKKIASSLGLPVAKCTLGKFANGETSVIIDENVRSFDVYIIQSISNPNLNDNLMELLIMVDAVRRSSAFRVTAVVPYFGYARQDKKEKGRAAIACKLVASMLQRVGVDRLIAVDLHSSVIKGFWDIPVENLSVEPLFMTYIKRNIFQHLDDEYCKNEGSEYFRLRESEDRAEKIIVSPDEGGANRAKSIADQLGLEFAIIYTTTVDHKEEAKLVGNVEGRVAILVDDMADTCTKLKRAVDLLMSRGALDVHGFATHGLFSADALSKVAAAGIQEMVVTNSVAASEGVSKTLKIKRLDISKLIAEAIRRQHYGELGTYNADIF